MAFKSTSHFEFSSDDGTKPVKQDFIDKTIRATVTGTELEINWQIIKKSKFNSQRVIIFESDSSWQLYANSTRFVHEDGKFWEPDLLMMTFLISSLDSIRRGEFISSGASEFLLSLFDHTEVDILNEESIFHLQFPRFFQYRKNHIDKLRERIVKTTLKS